MVFPAGRCPELTMRCQERTRRTTASPASFGSTRPSSPPSATAVRTHVSVCSSSVCWYRHRRMRRGRLPHSFAVPGKGAQAGRCGSALKSEPSTVPSPSRTVGGWRGRLGLQAGPPVTAAVLSTGDRCARALQVHAHQGDRDRGRRPRGGRRCRGRPGLGTTAGEPDDALLAKVVDDAGYELIGRAAWTINSRIIPGRSVNVTTPSRQLGWRGSVDRPTRPSHPRRQLGSPRRVSRVPLCVALRDLCIHRESHGFLTVLSTRALRLLTQARTEEAST